MSSKVLVVVVGGAACHLDGHYFKNGVECTSAVIEMRLPFHRRCVEIWSPLLQTACPSIEELPCTSGSKSPGQVLLLERGDALRGWEGKLFKVRNTNKSPGEFCL